MLAWGNFMMLATNFLMIAWVLFPGSEASIVSKLPRQWAPSSEVQLLTENPRLSMNADV